MVDRNAEKVTANLVKLLKERRLAKGLSHQTVADISGLSRSTISRVESGLRTPTITVCIKIAAAIGADLADLVKRAGKG